MTDKEKFRKEVEKLKSSLIHGACSSQIAMETRCKEEAYNEVLAILDSMQEEPVSKNYRERYKRIAQSEKFKKIYEGMSVGEIMHVEGEEPVSEDLGDYINELSKQFPEVSFAKLSRIAVRVAKWQKEQMMAKAVDGYVIKDVEEGNGDFLLSADYLPKSMGLKDQQRVKVIVIKGN